MSEYRPLLTRALFAGAFALALPLAALARPGEGMRCDSGTDRDHRMHEMCCEQHEHARHCGHDGPDGDHPSMLLRGLDLSDAQREQVRQLMRDAAEAQQDRAETLRRAHDELREQTVRKVYELLTPEQRQQLAERRKQRMERREERMGCCETCMERREHEDHAPEGDR